MKKFLFVFLILAASSAMAADPPWSASMDSILATECVVKNPLCVKIQLGTLHMGKWPDDIKYDHVFLGDLRLNDLAVDQTTTKQIAKTTLKAKSAETTFVFDQTPFEIWLTPKDLRKLAAQTTFSLKGTLFLWLGGRIEGVQNGAQDVQRYPVELTFTDSDHAFARSLSALLEEKERAGWTGSESILNSIPSEDLQDAMTLVREQRSINFTDGKRAKTANKWIQFVGLRIDDRSVSAPAAADDPGNTFFAAIEAPPTQSQRLDSELIPIGNLDKTWKTTFNQQPSYREGMKQLSVEPAGKQNVYRLAGSKLPAWNKLPTPTTPIPHDGDTVVLTIFRLVDLGADSFQVEHVAATRHGEEYRLMRAPESFGYRDTETYTSLVGSPVFCGDRLIGVLGINGGGVLPAPPVPTREKTTAAPVTEKNKNPEPAPPPKPKTYQVTFPRRPGKVLIEGQNLGGDLPLTVQLPSGIYQAEFIPPLDGKDYETTGLTVPFRVQDGPIDVPPPDGFPRLRTVSPPPAAKPQTFTFLVVNAPPNADYRIYRGDKTNFVYVDHGNADAAFTLEKGNYWVLTTYADQSQKASDPFEVNRDLKYQVPPPPNQPPPNQKVAPKPAATTFTLSIAALPAKASYTVYQGDKKNYKPIKENSVEKELPLAPGEYWLRITYGDGKTVDGRQLTLNADTKFTVPAESAPPVPAKKAPCDPNKGYCP